MSKTFSVSIDSPDLGRRYSRLVVEADDTEAAKRVAAELVLRDSNGRGISPALASLSQDDRITAIVNYAEVVE